MKNNKLFAYMLTTVLCLMKTDHQLDAMMGGGRGRETAQASSRIRDGRFTTTMPRRHREQPIPQPSYVTKKEITQPAEIIINTLATAPKPIHEDLHTTLFDRFTLSQWINPIPGDGRNLITQLFCLAHGNCNEFATTVNRFLVYVLNRLAQEHATQLQPLWEKEQRYDEDTLLHAAKRGIDDIIRALIAIKQATTTPDEFKAYLVTPQRTTLRNSMTIIEAIFFGERMHLYSNQSPQQLNRNRQESQVYITELYQHYQLPIPETIQPITPVKLYAWHIKTKVLVGYVAGIPMLEDGRMIVFTDNNTNVYRWDRTTRRHTMVPGMKCFKDSQDDDWYYAQCFCGSGFTPGDYANISYNPIHGCFQSTRRTYLTRFCEEDFFYYPHLPRN